MCRNLVDKYQPEWTGTTKIVVLQQMPVLRTFTFFPDSAFLPGSVEIMVECDGMHNLGLGQAPINSL